jgi:glycosyltransferase involved in cell wall biosynthesis
MNHDELAEIFTISDYFCINSDYDASPKVINEAMNFALPIICKNTIGTSEDLIINKYNGYIYKNDDDLLNIFRKIINNSKEIKYKGVNSQKILDNKFNYSNCLATLNNIIH